MKSAAHYNNNYTIYNDPVANKKILYSHHNQLPEYHGRNSCVVAKYHLQVTVQIALLNCPSNSWHKSREFPPKDTFTYTDPLENMISLSDHHKLVSLNQCTCLFLEK